MAIWKSGFELPFDDDGGTSPSTAAEGHRQDRNPSDGAPGPWRPSFETLLGRSPPGAVGDEESERPGRMYGMPDEGAIGFEARRDDDTCAIRSQETIIEQFTHKHIDEAELIREAEDHGWYRPGEGTRLQDIGKLLELHGVAIRRYVESNVIQLAQELAAGHKVILAVNAEELWAGSSELAEILDATGDNKPNHAVVVTGINTRDPYDLRVIVNDPATGEAERGYPLGQFLDAWKDSHFAMVATRDPVPPTAPEMRSFDYVRGLFERVGEELGIHLPHHHEDADPDSSWLGGRHCPEPDGSAGPDHLHEIPEGAHHDRADSPHPDPSGADASLPADVAGWTDGWHPVEYGDDATPGDQFGGEGADHDPFNPLALDMG